MKKLLFTIMTIGLIVSASSCKKCGYCAYGGGQSNGSAVCKNATLGALGADGYKEAEAQCQADGGNWVLTK